MQENTLSPFESNLPKLRRSFPRGLYNPFPVFPVNKTIRKGYDNLAQLISDAIPAGLRVLCIDGFPGLDWMEFERRLENALSDRQISAAWVDMQSCLAASGQIDQSLEPFLGGDDRLFGTQYPFGAEVFFEAAAISKIRIDASVFRNEAAGKIMIIFGCGAGLIEQWDQIWYVDIPKDVLQAKVQSSRVTNFGMNTPQSFEKFYKRAYFIEWPAFNRHKQRLLPVLDLFIDGQDSGKPVFITGNDFRSSLAEVAETPFRVRPWFFPGPWGGQFMKGHMGLDPQQPNFAWSFELIVPENGIVLENDGEKIEFAFDFLMFQENRRVLGENASRQFKYEWPIRLDYLDTVSGGNLSTQVHPRPRYIRENFGETYTQDESYYIIAAEPDSRVYLGLTEDCQADEFRHALEESQNTGKKVDIDKFVNSEPSKPHDLFLIPNGTVHCSGAGNLVLEISATPYIFTFKIYDYLRRDLQGNLRPINIQRAFSNIRFERRKNWVRENLIAKPKLVGSGPGWEKYVLYDKPFTFYEVHRLEFEREYEMDTADRAFAVNLVEGRQIEIITGNGRKNILSFIESMVIPAATGHIKFVNTSGVPCKLLLVFVKDDIGKSRSLNSPGD